MSEYVFRYYKFDIPEDASDDYATENADHYGTIHEPIVRCRDCKYFNAPCECRRYRNFSRVHENGFCAWSCRRSDKE